MKKLFYYFVKYSIKIASHCYFRKIRIYGLENIPNDGGVIFSPNHQGAFLDPLLVGCNIPRPITSLTRSDVFGGPLQWFMDALKMLPVYRIRNGFANLKKNDAIFDRCKKLLAGNQWIMIFSEASHHSEFFLQALSKGSSRLAYESQLEAKNPIYIVPVGINYGHHTNPFCDLHLVFGEPIAIKSFVQSGTDKPASINSLREVLRLGMKKCLWLPEKDEHYEDRKGLIHSGNTLLNFRELKRGIEEQNLSPRKVTTEKKWQKIIFGFFSIPNLPPLLILKKILGLFKDIVFYSSIKMCVGGVLLVLWWASILIISNILWGWGIASLNVFVCIGLLYARQKLSVLYFK